MSYDRRKPLDVESLVSVKVDNLSYRTNADQLKRAFDKFGEIGDVYIPRDPYGHEASRGFGFVRFYDSRDADDAVHAMDGVTLNGREIRVQLARHSRSHRSDFVSRSRRHYPRRSRSRTRSRSRSRHRRRRSRSSSRDHRRRTRSRSRSRSRDRRRSRSRSRTSRKRDMSRSRSRSRSHKRRRPDENGSRSSPAGRDDGRGSRDGHSPRDVDFKNNAEAQLDMPSSRGGDASPAAERESDRDASALSEEAEQMRKDEVGGGEASENEGDDHKVDDDSKDVTYDEANSAEDHNGGDRSQDDSRDFVVDEEAGDQSWEEDHGGRHELENSESADCDHSGACEKEEDKDDDACNKPEKSDNETPQHRSKDDDEECDELMNE